MTLRQAGELLQKHGVPGYSCLESIRKRIVVNNAIPHEKVGKYYFVQAAGVHKLIGEQPQLTAPTEDQALLKFYQEDPENDFVKATVLGIARSIQHARFVYEIHQDYMRSPKIRATQIERAREAELLAASTRKCSACARTIDEARSDGESVVSAVAGEQRGSFALDEEIKLKEFVKHRCPECFFWRTSAPVEAMRAKILAPDEADADQPDEKDFSPTAPSEASAKTADGSKSATPSAGAEEAPPLPTTQP